MMSSGFDTLFRIPDLPLTTEGLVLLLCMR